SGNTSQSVWDESFVEHRLDFTNCGLRPACGSGRTGQYRRRTRMLQRPISFALVLILAAAIPSLGRSQIKLASVPSEYIPIAASELPEPVSMPSFSFEVNEKTGRARIFVEYTYPDQPTFGIDGGAGPKPTYVQLPGLTYDQNTQTVVYESGNARIICANIRKGRLLFWQRTIMEPTGACVVSARVVDHAEDEGWTIRRFRALDTFFDR